MLNLTEYTIWLLVVFVGTSCFVHWHINRKPLITDVTSELKQKYKDL